MVVANLVFSVCGKSVSPSPQRQNMPNCVSEYAKQDQNMPNFFFVAKKQLVRQ